MIHTYVETKPEKPVPFEEFEEFPIRLQELFDTMIRRPIDLLEARPHIFGREFEKFFKPELEVFRPVYVRLYETEEALLLRAEVPGFTEKELDITVEPWRVIITAKKEWKELKEEKKELTPIYKEMYEKKIYKTVKLPFAIKPEEVKAILKDGVLEFTLPKLEPIKKVHVLVKAS